MMNVKKNVRGKMEQVTVKFKSADIDILDSIAAEEELSRSAVIRKIVTKWIKGELQNKAEV